MCRKDGSYRGNAVEQVRDDVTITWSRWSARCRSTDGRWMRCSSYVDELDSSECHVDVDDASARLPATDCPLHQCRQVRQAVSIPTLPIPTYRANDSVRAWGY